ncbi:AraC family transcriptional regulator [Leucobacter komagatae]|uniref:Cupin n=1 Tax=Leucobacter komagatae TaxID=55969 RepID=A0A0D0IKM4_9MICO|nr:AraC family transcriptional regulator [Leucobacter komagatae]KIP51652.1 cupin [Leucobacter komagatae]
MRSSTESVQGQRRLSRVLHTLRMRGTFYCQAELRRPWALSMPAVAESVSFHVVMAGSGCLRVAASEPVELREGDLALVPHGRGHDLLSAPGTGTGPRVDLLPQHYLSEHYSRLEYGGGGTPTQLVCGVVACDSAAARELMPSLPEVMVIRRNEGSSVSAVRDALRLMASELSHPQLGGEAVATRLADILVVLALRDWLAANPSLASGWLRAIQDEHIGRALDAIHDDPGHSWSVDDLAKLATMSRSSFSARFTELVGVSPISYLTRWRMNIARSRLAEDDVQVSVIAAELGYRSEAAFHRAFVRLTGLTPGALRRAGRV